MENPTTVESLTALAVHATSISEDPKTALKAPFVIHAGILAWDQIIRAVAVHTGMESAPSGMSTFVINGVSFRCLPTLPPTQIVATNYEDCWLDVPRLATVAPEMPVNGLHR